MRPPRAMLAAVAAAGATWLAGCASPSPAPILLSLPPTVTGFATPAPAAPQTPPTAGASGPATLPLLAIRRVGIPEYLISRRVRYRADPSTLAEWPNTYWAERIEIGVSREFVSALRPLLPGWSICEASCGDATPTLTLQVELVPMDFVRSARQLQARARLTLSAADVSQRVVAARELGYQLAADADTAQAQAQVLSELLRQVAGVAAPMVLDARR